MESSSGPAPHYDPREALADVAASRESVADRLVTPWWYHPILGALLSAIVLVHAFDLPTFVQIAVPLVSAVGMGVLVGAYQRVTGLWVDARNLGSTSRRWWLAYAGVVIVVVAVPVATGLTEYRLPFWAALACTAIALGATIVLGRRIDSAMREEIRAGRAPVPESR